MENFKKYHNVKVEINLETKMEDDRLYVLYKTKWIPITQKKEKGKPYSVKTLKGMYGINLLRALKLVDAAEPVQEEILIDSSKSMQEWDLSKLKLGTFGLKPGYYTKNFVWSKNTVYCMNKNGTIWMDKPGEWLDIRIVVVDVLKLTDEELWFKYGDLDEFLLTLVRELWENTKRSGKIIVDILELERKIQGLSKGSLFDLAVRIYPEKEKVDCSICLIGLKSNDKVIKTECEHWFHCDCIFTWLKEKPECPCCRSKTTLHGIIRKKLIDRS